MKLHSIHFANINCLAGEWRIDFEVPELADGIFVLSGPTGAGKSSILDAITLALFGQTARQGQVTSGANEVMNRAAFDCFAEAEFTGSDGRRYRSRWSQHRPKSRDGTTHFDAPDMSLVDIGSGADISPSRLNDAKTLVAAKVGFRFEDFIRTVLLEQGRFDEFLHAKEKDRASILEKATDTAKFSRLGVRINERAKEETRKTAKLAERLAAARELVQKDSTPDDLLRQASERDAAADMAAKRAETLRREKAWLDEATAIDDEAADIQRAADELETRRAADDEAAAVLAAADRARALLADHATRNAHVLAVRNARNALAKRTAEATQLAEVIPNAEQRAAMAATALDEVARTLREAAPLLDEARRLDGEVALAMQARTGAETSAKPLRVALSAARTALAAARKKSSDADATLTAARADVEKASAKRNELEPLRTAFCDAESAKSRAESAYAEASRVFDAETEPRLTAIIQSLEEKQKLAIAVKNLEQHRAHLRPGEPCPLCGSTEHPYAEGLPTPDDVQDEIDARKNELKTARDGVAALLRAAEKARKTHDKARNALQTAETTIANAIHAADAALQVANAEKVHADETVRQREEAQTFASDAAAEAEKRVALAAESLSAAMLARKRVPIADANAEEKRLQDIVKQATDDKTAAETHLELARSKARTADAERKEAADLLAKAEAESARVSAAFETCLRNAGFDSESTWTAACLPDARYGELKRSRVAFARDDGALAGRREALARRRGLHETSPGRPAERRGKDAVVAELAEAEKAHERAVAEAAELRAGAEAQTEARGNVAKAEADHAAQKATQTAWDNLDKWLGGPDGANFQRYAQGRNLRVLLDAASPRLEAMSGGDFRFEWDPSSGSLEPLVRDRHFERPRPVSNLSGGESFLASLALALSFANVNASHDPIETLFLDEGFGTLDSAALDRALDVLATLRDTGRQVGLVTHVEQVKERIPAHIDVEKRGDGRSVLSGPGVIAS